MEPIYPYYVAWTSDENYKPMILCHPEKLSQEEFADMLRLAMKKAIPELLKRDDWIGVDHIVEKAVEILKEVFGFRNICFAAKLEIPGTFIIFNKSDFPTGFLSEESLEEICKHNRVFEEKLREKIRRWHSSHQPSRDDP